jgi:hypothetical protein
MPPTLLGFSYSWIGLLAGFKLRLWPSYLCLPCRFNGCTTMSNLFVETGGRVSLTFFLGWPQTAILLISS